MKEKDINELLEKLKKESEPNLFGDNSLWVIMILALLFSQPPKQEPPIININIGDDKNV